MDNKYCVKCTGILGKQKDRLSKNHVRQQQ